LLKGSLGKRRTSANDEPAPTRKPPAKTTARPKAKPVAKRLTTAAKKTAPARKRA